MKRHPGDPLDEGEASSTWRVLLLFATTGYEADDFVTAAQKLGIRYVFGTDRCHVLPDPWQDGALPLRFEDPEAAAQIIVDYAQTRPIHAIVSIGDKPARTAALACRALGIPYNPPEAVAICRNKFKARQRLQTAGMKVPPFRCLPSDHMPGAPPLGLSLPCVLKPLALSASQGVIRADTTEQFMTAFQRISALLHSPNIQVKKDETTDWILVEGFIPGQEVALEGLMDQGNLYPLALFDKPDPLDGPFFEETLYITPSRLDKNVQAEIIRCTEQAAKALGLFHGPIHAELRVNEEGPWILEVAARSMGGL